MVRVNEWKRKLCLLNNKKQNVCVGWNNTILSGNEQKQITMGEHSVEQKF